MTAQQKRRRTMQRILSVIGQGVDQGDGVAAIMEIDTAERSGAITPQDARRLFDLVAEVLGDSLHGLRRLIAWRGGR